MKRTTFEGRFSEGQTCSFFPLGGIFCPPASAALSSGSANMNSLISKDFDALTPEEQDQVYRDLYGINDIVDETEEFVQEKLQELNNELSAIPDDRKEAYLWAESQEHDYVSNRNFRLMFLRSSRFDAQKAARCIVKHFEFKLNLFGKGRLARPLRQSDLSEDDMESLLAGGARVVGKDRAGRGIVYSRRMAFKYKTIDNLLRAVWYTFMASVQNDEETQKNGIVSLTWNIGYFAPGMFNRQFYKNMSRIAKNALPIRIVGNHHCYNDFKERAVTQVMMMFLPKDMKTRYRSHVGSASECLFELMTFGISPDILPINEQGDIEIQSHIDWVNKQREEEESAMEIC